MILISHERSGSEWFCRSIHGIEYVGYEIFGALDNLRLSRLYTTISPQAKISILRCHSKTKIHKIHARQLVDNGDELLNFLKTRTDLYLLERRNLRASIISALIASEHMNFHESSALLKREFIAKRETFKIFLKWFTDDVQFAKDKLHFVERFVYEDLLAGATPRTIQFDLSLSPIQKRESMKYVHLIKNYAEVQQWFEEYNVRQD